MALAQSIGHSPAAQRLASERRVLEVEQTLLPERLPERRSDSLASALVGVGIREVGQVGAEADSASPKRLKPLERL